MNIIDYVNKNGDYSFNDKKFNEVDKLILALLSYFNYDNLVSSNTRNKKTIEEVGKEYFNTYDEKKIKHQITAIRDCIKLLKLLASKKRYKDLLLYNYIYVGDDSEQFSAVCIEINPKLIYVSFEGTDHLISGWEEDFKMAYKFPVSAQRKAIKYLNRHFVFKDCQLIIGGHSKGGNLALVASMYANILVRDKIIEVYSYDGPGLRDKQFQSKKYKRIEDRFKHIIPNYSIVGIILRHSSKDIVIKSNRMGLMAHRAETWQVNDDDFVKANLSNSSKILDKGILRWLNRYSDKERKIFVTEIFNVFRRTGITSLVEIMENYELILKIFKDSSNVDKVVLKMFKELVDVLIACNKDNVLLFFAKEKKTIDKKED